MTRTTRYILTILAVAVATFAAIDPAGVPAWVQALLAALATGFAAVGIIPPGMVVQRTSRGTIRAETTKERIK